MAETQLVQRLEGIRRILMAHHAAGSLLPNATKGGERETLLREFLAKVFPSPIRFGSGAVIDQSKRTSGQIDIVAEFPFFPSFPTPGADERLYLAESVSFVIEVKSNLSSQWAQVESSAKNFLPLRRRWKGHLEFNSGTLNIADPSTSRIPFVAIGYTGFTSIVALKKKLLETPQEHRPDAALILESGAYVGLPTDSIGVGPEGLFAFCVDAAYFANNVFTATPDFRGYFSGNNTPAS